MDLQPYIDSIRSFCRGSKIARLGVFGSVARGSDTAKSDIDILIDLKEPIGFVELIRLEDRLQKILGRKVDLASRNSLHPLIRERVMSDYKIIYEE